MRLIFVILLAAFSFSIQAQRADFDFYEVDSTSFEREMFRAKSRVIYASSFAATGAVLITVGKQIQKGNINTTIHPDNAYWPGYALIGVAFVTAVNAWLHLRNAEFISEEYGIGVSIPLRFEIPIP